MTITVRQSLLARGNKVCIISTGEGAPEKYMVDEYRIPFFDGLIKPQEMTIAKPNRKALEETARWADIVHVLMPFPLSLKGEKVTP